MAGRTERSRDLFQQKLLAVAERTGQQGPVWRKLAKAINEAWLTTQRRERQLARRPDTRRRLVRRKPG
jgi:hypothetical protein